MRSKRKRTELQMGKIQLTGSHRLLHASLDVSNLGLIDASIRILSSFVIGDMSAIP